MQITPGRTQRIVSILARLLPFGKAGGLQILRCKGFAVDFTTTLPLTPCL